MCSVPDNAERPAGHPARPLWVRVAVLPFLGAIHLYRCTLSPVFGGQCRFYPTCSQYGLDAYRLHNPLWATWLTARRLARCHPFGGSGYDPVPAPPTSK